MAKTNYRVTIDTDDDCDILFRGFEEGAYFDVVTDDVVALIDEIRIVTKYDSWKAEEMRNYLAEAKKEYLRSNDFQAGGNRTVTVTNLELSVREILYGEN